MLHPEVDTKEPIRLFKSDFLEFFTHIHPAVVLLIWAPVIGYFVFLAVSARPAEASALHIPIGLIIGLGTWTLAEYVLHRFVFHFRPRSPWQERVSFLFHGVHHAQPMSKTRLVMPPAVSIPLALAFYGLFYGLIAVILHAPHWVAPLFAGFGTGYLCYDMLHYSIHHIRIRSGYFRSVRKHHMQHHGKTPNQRFGVTSKVWDKVFGTDPA